MPDPKKPRIALLVDRPGWAYDRAAQALAAALADRFSFEILYVVDRPAKPDCDLLHVFFWGETWHQRWGLPPARVVKEVSSHRWNEPGYGNLTPDQFVAQHLRDAGHLTATSRRLQRVVAPLREIAWCPNGVHVPADVPDRRGDVRFGWAGNANDPCKGLHDVIAPAAGDDFVVEVADGQLPPAAMPAFYRQLDVLLVASSAEGEPLTLLEAMAHGCFPIATDVGIVEELVAHGDNGLVVARTPAAVRAAMQWAACNPALVRRKGRENALRMRRERGWNQVAAHWAAAWQRALVACGGADLQEFNNGVQLGQWPERALRAAQLVRELALPPGSRVLDLGCGQQTVRALLPDGVDYRPFDRIARTDDTTVCDLTTQRPDIDGDVAMLLGVLEYLPDPRPVLDWVAANCRHLVLSYNDCRDPARRAQQHWRSQLSLDDVEHHLLQRGGVVRSLTEIGRDERLYRVTFAPRDVLVPATPRKPQLVAAAPDDAPIALFTAGLHGDNSGDALIEHAIRALLPGSSFERFPLVQRPDDAAIERANACRIGVLCGTNLYQRVFASGIDLDVLRRLRIPLLPLGIGGSSTLGGRIEMDASHVAVVRELHERCEVASVRDPQSYEFVRRIGVRNVELTGCPVLFSGIERPDFTPREGRLALSLRARLLHVPESQAPLAEALLEQVCRERAPLLVLQSPYDLPQAERLSAAHGLDVVADPGWQADALLAALPQVRASTGLRLHWNMLCLAHGIPAALLGTDTRTESFCDLLGLPFHALADTSADALLRSLDAFDPTRFLRRWQVLQGCMQRVLAQNGMVSAWQMQPEAAR